jgi:hypothetical protein
MMMMMAFTVIAIISPAVGWVSQKHGYNLRHPVTLAGPNFVEVVVCDIAALFLSSSAELFLAAL